MGQVITGMDAVYAPTCLLAEIALCVFGFMALFFVIYLILGKI
jgi:hypothetical protein